MTIPDPQQFLAQHGWGDAAVAPFPADWSARRYARLRRAAQPQRAILMQTTPDPDFFNFVFVANLLRDLQASAPEIYAIDTQGMLLLEDFGDGNFGRLIDQGADPEIYLRRAAITLAEMQQRYSAAPDATKLARYDSAAFIALLTPLLENFSYPDAAVAQNALRDCWSALLAPLAAMSQSLLLRDFMVDNLMDLPERPGWQNVGLLDFELAGVGPIAYDLASLLEQVRRDLPDALRTAIIAAYLTARPDLDADALRHALPIMAAHRHLRIFARLQKLPKPQFLKRTHAHLQKLLAQPTLRPAQIWCQTYLPQHFA